MITTPGRPLLDLNYQRAWDYLESSGNSVRSKSYLYQETVKTHHSPDLELMFDCSYRTIHSLILRGFLEGEIDGRDYMVCHDSLISFVEDRKKGVNHQAEEFIHQGVALPKAPQG